LSDALALLLAVALLEFFAVVLFGAIAALAAIDPFAAELLLLALLCAAALWPLRCSWSSPVPVGSLRLRSGLPKTC
jgi:hypothetical protein